MKDEYLARGELHCLNCRGVFYDVVIENYDQAKAACGSMFRIKEKYGSHGENWTRFLEYAEIRDVDLFCPGCMEPYPIPHENIVWSVGIRVIGKGRAGHTAWKPHRSKMLKLLALERGRLLALGEKNVEAVLVGDVEIKEGEPDGDAE